MSYLVNQMINSLSNKVLRQESAKSDRDYSGGGWYEEIKHAIYLYSDFSAMYTKESFRSISAGGLYAPNQSSEKQIGTWSISEENGKVYLEMIFEDNFRHKLETKDLGTGVQEVCGEIWKRYVIS